jgi:hypothetical protein
MYWKHVKLLDNDSCWIWHQNSVPGQRPTISVSLTLLVHLLLFTSFIYRFKIYLEWLCRCMIYVADQVWPHQSQTAISFLFSATLKFVVYLSPFTNYTLTSSPKVILTARSRSWPNLTSPVGNWRSIFHRLRAIPFLTPDRKRFMPLGSAEHENWHHHLIGKPPFPSCDQCFFLRCRKPFPRNQRFFI